MRFVPCPEASVRFCIWETRVQDFRAFVQATSHNARSNVWSLTTNKWELKGVTWEAPGFAQTDRHPVCGVSWEDARAFCRWLTGKEQQEGRISANAAYRLPTDTEWSSAAGPAKYVWGEAWPPPRGAGNLAGEEARDKDWPRDFAVIQGYNDGYARTSPVGSFLASLQGLYDLEGNVLEWCEDWYLKEMNTEEVRKAWAALDDDGGGQKYRVLRGASWLSNSNNCRSAYRNHRLPRFRYYYIGFRVWLACRGWGPSRPPTD